MAGCAIVAACDFNEADFRERMQAEPFDLIIAADAGFAHLQEAGLAPDSAVGDFDSLGYVPDVPNVDCHPVHKDESDLELALRLAAERKCERIVVYGALGGRLDHTMAAMHICAFYAENGFDMEMVGADAKVKILVGPATYELSLRESGTVSVFSATDESRGVTETGLEYPLENAVLVNRTTLGLSNEFIGQPASVSVEAGTLYIIQSIA